MADEISRVEYYVAAIPHKAGEGARALTAFKDAGMNLRGCLGYRKTARNAEIIFVLDEKTPGVSEFNAGTHRDVTPSVSGLREASEADCRKLCRAEVSLG
jgi:hypothetical protein